MGDLNRDDVISLRSYFEYRIGSVREILDARIDHINVSISLARDILDERLETMNKIRESLREQASTFVARDELNMYKDHVDSDLRMLRESKACLEGKASQKSVNISLGIAIFGLVIGLFSLVVRYTH